MLDDARLLLYSGSSGAALALAILAFEEAGKGYHIELSVKKTKWTPSWHQFRQVTASFVLVASVYQKHGLPPPELTPRMQELLKEGTEGVKTFAEFAAKPPPEEFRQLAGDVILANLRELDGDSLKIALVEFRWVRIFFYERHPRSDRGLSTTRDVR
ncbi:MAG: AbiV family abortive infection protein [Alphaproteobacteria bacterium]|nr:AbiV family abortive infection protein [Alphaproteobacteria bacterium]